MECLKQQSQSCDMKWNVKHNKFNAHKTCMFFKT